jgi:transcriptional regulator with XRE-family HTH domain
VPMDIKTIREQKFLTQEELAEQTGLSVRTIQRIEAGQEPKGHTAKVLADVLGIDLKAPRKNKNPKELIDYRFVKRINLSAAFVCMVPFLNIILPLILSRYYKQSNRITKSIISLQVLWTIISTMAIIIAGHLKLTFDLHHQTGLWVFLSLVIMNQLMIILNAASIDKNQALRFELGFVVI